MRLVAVCRSCYVAAHGYGYVATGGWLHTFYRYYVATLPTTFYLHLGWLRVRGYRTFTRYAVAVYPRARVTWTVHAVLRLPTVVYLHVRRHIPVAVPRLPAAVYTVWLGYRTAHGCRLVTHHAHRYRSFITCVCRFVTTCVPVLRFGYLICTAAHTRRFYLPYRVLRWTHLVPGCSCTFGLFYHHAVRTYPLLPVHFSSRTRAFTPPLPHYRNTLPHTTHARLRPLPAVTAVY